MKRVLFILIAGSFLGINILAARTSKKTELQPAVVANINTEYLTPTFAPTQTPIPSATIGYESTAIVAQQTADEARRVNAETTAQHEQMQLGYAQLTAGAEQRDQAVALWTAVMVSTAIPLTATQQAVMNTQAANQIVLQLGQLTATYQAPTQMAVIADIESRAKYARLDRVMQTVGVFAIAIFCVSLSVFLLRWKPTPRAEPRDPETQTVVQLRRDQGQGSFSQKRVVIPCSPEQLTELAELAVNGEKKFGINRLETQSRTFRSQRETLLAVRQWLLDNEFVISDGNGTITLNKLGEDFLFGWFDLHKLPDNYDFVDVEPPPHTRDFIETTSPTGENAT